MTSVGGKEPRGVCQSTNEDVQGVAWCQAEAIKAKPDGAISRLYQPLAVSVRPADRFQESLLPPNSCGKVANQLSSGYMYLC